MRRAELGKCCEIHERLVRVEDVEDVSGRRLIKVICGELDITSGCSSQVALCLQI